MVRMDTGGHILRFDESRALTIAQTALFSLIDLLALTRSFPRETVRRRSGRSEAARGHAPPLSSSINVVGILPSLNNHINHKCRTQGVWHVP